MVLSHDHGVTEMHATFYSPQKTDCLNLQSWRRLNTSKHSWCYHCSWILRQVWAVLYRVSCKTSHVQISPLRIIVSDALPCSAVRQNILVKDHHGTHTGTLWAPAGFHHGGTFPRNLYFCLRANPGTIGNCWEVYLQEEHCMRQCNNLLYHSGRVQPPQWTLSIPMVC